MWKAILKPFEVVWDFLESSKLEPQLLIAILGMVLFAGYAITHLSRTGQIANWLIEFFPFWGIAVFAALFWYLWNDYVISNANWNEQQYIVLEIRPSADIVKSPAAMELILNTLHIGSGETTWIDTRWKGKTRPTFSFEIVSTEGRLRFMIFTRKVWKDLIEAELYSQYPNIEIIQVPDYTYGLVFDPPRTALWGNEYVKDRKDHHQGDPNRHHRTDWFPIRTYIDYKMDKDPKEEYKLDPMANLTEWLGSMGPGEHLWVQIVWRVHKGDTGKIAKAVSDKLIAEAQPPRDAEGKPVGFGRFLAKPESDLIELIYQWISKPLFEVGVRIVYLTEADKFRPINIFGTIFAMKPFNKNLGGNNLAATEYTSYDYPWEDYNNHLLYRKRRKMLEAFKRREFFYEPFDRTEHVSILNSEELATLWHLPSQTITTPTLVRTPSKRAQAPVNLPL